jgi:hypothetical protein
MVIAVGTATIGLFTLVRGIDFLRTSPFGDSANFAKCISSLDRAGVSFGGVPALPLLTYLAGEAGQRR